MLVWTDSIRTAKAREGRAEADVPRTGSAQALANLAKPMAQDQNLTASILRCCAREAAESSGNKTEKMNMLCGPVLLRSFKVKETRSPVQRRISEWNGAPPSPCSNSVPEVVGVP